MKRRAPDGFTLLELLLAVSVMALITGSIMGGMGIGRRAWETSRASEALDEVENAARGVAGLLARSVAVTQATTTTPSFQGTPGSCRFVALSEGGAQWGGLILTEIGGDGTDLAVWTRTFKAREAAAPGRAGMRKTVLLRNVAFFQLGFFGPPMGGRPAGWGPGWNNPANLPQLVSVKIGAYRLGRVIEAEATVALRQQ